MEIKCKEQIHYSLRQAEDMLESLQRALLDNSYYIESALDEYDASERNISRWIGELPTGSLGLNSMNNIRPKVTEPDHRYKGTLTLEPARSLLPNPLMFCKAEVKSEPIKNDLIKIKSFNTYDDITIEPWVIKRDGKEYSKTISYVSKADYKNNEEYISAVMKAMEIEDFSRDTIDSRYGWFLVSPEEAQEMADDGFPTLALEKGKEGQRILLIEPSDNTGGELYTKGLRFSCFSDKAIMRGYINNWESDSEKYLFYTHP